MAIQSLIIIFLVLISFCFGCARPTPIPDQYTAEAKVYQKNCSACHSLPHPARMDFKWIAPRIKVMDKDKMPVYSNEEKEAILNYLKVYPSEEKTGKKIYNLRCGACHPPFPPEELDYKEWKERITVLTRAQMPVFSEKEKDSVLVYIRKFAKGVK
jgi:cytochrome c5